MEQAAIFIFIHRPCGSAGGVTCGEMRGEDCAAESHCVAVAQNAIDMGGRIAKGRIGAEKEVSLAAGLDGRNVGVHDVVFCAGELDDLRAACAVIVMGVADEENFNV